MLRKNTENIYENLVQFIIVLLWEIQITKIKPCELNMDSDVHNPLKGPNIPFIWYECLTCQITKYDAHREALFTYEARSSWSIRVC